MIHHFCISDTKPEMLGGSQVIPTDQSDLDIVHFPMLLLLSGILYLMTLDIFSQSMHLKLP